MGAGAGHVAQAVWHGYVFIMDWYEENRAICERKKMSKRVVTGRAEVSERDNRHLNVKAPRWRGKAETGGLKVPWCWRKYIMIRLTFLAAVR